MSQIVAVAGLDRKRRTRSERNSSVTPADHYTSTNTQLPLTSSQAMSLKTSSTRRHGCIETRGYVRTWCRRCGETLQLAVIGRRALPTAAILAGCRRIRRHPPFPAGQLTESCQRPSWSTNPHLYYLSITVLSSGPCNPYRVYPSTMLGVKGSLNNPRQLWSNHLQERRYVSRLYSI